jgi:diguanylate cyclase (GGDEF)-like protein
MASKNRWGALLFAGAVLVGVGAAWVLSTYRNPAFYGSFVPWAGVALSALAFAAGHFSYPRAHSFKVYLIGILSGVTGMGYFVLGMLMSGGPFSPVPAGFAACAVLIAFVNQLLVLFVPSNVKYRSTVRISFAVAGVEAIALLFLRCLPAVTDWTRALVYDGAGDWPFWIGLAAAAGIAALSARLLRDEFHLGGKLAGTALLLCCAWMAKLFPQSESHAQPLLFAGALVFLEIGMVVHWFSRMEHRISYDPLLHIYNRNFCSRIITEQSKLDTRPPFGVAMVDIDHFKNVNDTYGHQAGDVVLFNVAQAVQNGTAPDGICCRYGGEELIVFFPQKETKELEPIIEGVRTDVEKMKIKAGRKSITVTISCGISHRSTADQSVIDVIQAADKALYKAKEGGRNQVQTAKASVSDAHKKTRKPREESREIESSGDAAPAKEKKSTRKIAAATEDGARKTPAVDDNGGAPDDTPSARPKTQSIPAKSKKEKREKDE